ncbi:succinate dehydrogenase/fumarate reductase iron-sulfur subunit [Nitrospina watsonii]|uniref:succinate dehydrogenase n=1 Tax=Nitrospina watsonii TaxID=1323948 RepID=A0ABM9HCT0_9BACT|nr:succinate dehydrogenase iron-sulfur subunit [Nitrospina watsonii]CAI2717955.1 succinate dehydrogenase, iron-sulfur subunit [Nitrospina watsonii]
MATFRIKRFNPEKQPEPYYEDFEYDFPEGATLLDCMNHIKWTMDGTLTFRMSCRSAICGSCGMKANGRAVLACQRQAGHLMRDGVVTVEPLGNMKPIKDMVVDFKPFWDKIDAVKPYMENKGKPPEKEHRMSPEQFKLIDDSSTCIMCGNCYSDCNVLEVDDNFLGPAALAKAQRFVGDSRDQTRKDRVKELSKPGGMWDCTHCAECVERCPKPAQPFYRIKELMTVALEEGVTNNNGARHALSFTKSIKHSGRLNENTLPVESVGYFNVKGLMDLLPIGLRMILKGKMPPIIHRSIDDQKDVKRIFEELGE